MDIKTRPEGSCSVMFNLFMEGLHYLGCEECLRI